MNKRFKIRIPVGRVKEYLNQPTWYLWSKCKEELGIASKTRDLSVTETMLIIGWFALYHRSAKDCSRSACLSAFYAQSIISKAMPITMSGAEVLALKDRPSTSTLYRRGIKVDNEYTPSEIEELLKKWKA